VNRRSLNPFLAVLFGDSPYLIRINIAGEADYERTLRVTQHDDVRVTDQIQGVAGGSREDLSSLPVSRFLHRYYWVGLLVGRSRYGSPNFLQRHSQVLHLDLVTAVVEPPGGISRSDLRERLLHRFQQGFVGARLELP
jgi:hypothetical protein